MINVNTQKACYVFVSFLIMRSDVFVRAVKIYGFFSNTLYFMDTIKCFTIVIKRMLMSGLLD